MKNEYKEIIEIDEAIKKFVPFRNRHDHWGDSSNRPLIPNVVTVIPPDVDPELLPFLLYRMKLEELTYKSQHLDDQSINIIWTENKLDNFLFPENEDAFLSKAYECIRFEKHMLFQEIDKALPAVLPPEIILSGSTELPSVQHIKKNFKVSSQEQETAIKEPSFDYSDSSDQQKDSPDDKNETESENYDQTYENEYYQQPTSSKTFDNENIGFNSQSYNQPFNNQPDDILKIPKAPIYEEEQRPHPREFLDSVYSNAPPPLPPPQIQSSKPNLPFQEPYSQPQAYPNSHYMHGQPEFDNFSPQKQQQMPPPLSPPLIQNFDPSSSLNIPPPPPFLPPKQTHPPLQQQQQQQQQQQRMPPPLPPLPRDLRPLPPPPPLLKSGPPQGNPNRPEDGNQGGNQWNSYENY